MRPIRPWGECEKRGKPSAGHRRLTETVILRWKGSKWEKYEGMRHEENTPVDSDFDLIRYGKE